MKYTIKDNNKIHINLVKLKSPIKTEIFLKYNSQKTCLIPNLLCQVRSNQIKKFCKMMIFIRVRNFHYLILIIRLKKSVNSFKKK